MWNDRTNHLQWAMAPDNYSAWRPVGGRSGRDMLSAVWDVLLWHQGIKGRHEMWVTKSALDPMITMSAMCHSDYSAGHFKQESVFVCVCAYNQQPLKKIKLLKCFVSIELLHWEFSLTSPRRFFHIPKRWKCNQATRSENIKTSIFLNQLDCKLA